jgi:hypothetical protein
MSVTQPVAKRPREVRFRHWIASLVKTEKFLKLTTEKELIEVSTVAVFTYSTKQLIFCLVLDTVSACCRKSAVKDWIFSVNWVMFVILLCLNGLSGDRLELLDTRKAL